MKLIRPSFEILTSIEPDLVLKRIEVAGRTCYKSEDAISTTSATSFVEMIIKRGHESVLEHQSLSVRFICDRGVSHELVRHRLASFSQESTRYCNYSKGKFNNELTFIIPNWLDSETKGDIEFEAWRARMSYAENSYMSLIEKFNWQPQQARCILPNSLKTEIVVTANFREWRTIFKQRTSVAAHPQMRELMCPLLDELKSELPVVFGDINY